MWSIWRSSTPPQDLARCPAREAAGGELDDLIGTCCRTGGRAEEVTDPNTQVGIGSLEGQLPPSGVRLDKQDATVWNWVKTGPGPLSWRAGGHPDLGELPAPAQERTRSVQPDQRSTSVPLFTPQLAQRRRSAERALGCPWLGDTGRLVGQRFAQRQRGA